MATNSLNITLETVTPIWTGGADRKADRLHATGIMGSLRWWYEALVRGVGGRVCSADEPCRYDEDEELYQGLCDVCRIFGATGWARRFKLTVDKEHLHAKQSLACIIERGNRVFIVPHNGTTSRWYLPDDPRAGSFILKIVPTLPLNVAKLRTKAESPEYLDISVIAALIQFIADNASLGAKPQMGLGIVRLKDRQRIQPLFNHLERLVDLHDKNGDSVSFAEYDELPSLHTMFFALVETGQDSDLETFKLKQSLRKEFRQFTTSDVRHSIMGYAPKQWEDEDRQGAKIMISYPHDDYTMPSGNHTIRLWGWIPGKAGMQPPRKVILGSIYAFLEQRYGKGSVSDWIHFVLNGTQSGKSMLELLKKYLPSKESE
jgi:CRISPR-associated protein Cmr1